MTQESLEDLLKKRYSPEPKTGKKSLLGEGPTVGMQLMSKESDRKFEQDLRGFLAEADQKKKKTPEEEIQDILANIPPEQRAWTERQLRSSQTPLQQAMVAPLTTELTPEKPKLPATEMTGVGTAPGQISPENAARNARQAQIDIATGKMDERRKKEALLGVHGPEEYAKAKQQAVSELPIAGQIAYAIAGPETGLLARLPELLGTRQAFKSMRPGINPFKFNAPPNVSWGPQLFDKKGQPTGFVTDKMTTTPLGYIQKPETPPPQEPPLPSRAAPTTPPTSAPRTPRPSPVSIEVKPSGIRGGRAPAATMELKPAVSAISAPERPRLVGSAGVQRVATPPVLSMVADVKKMMLDPFPGRKISPAEEIPQTIPVRIPEVKPETEPSPAPAPQRVKPETPGKPIAPPSPVLPEREEEGETRREKSPYWLPSWKLFPGVAKPDVEIAPGVETKGKTEVAGKTDTSGKTITQPTTVSIPAPQPTGDEAIKPQPQPQPKVVIPLTTAAPTTTPGGVPGNSPSRLPAEEPEPEEQETPRKPTPAMASGWGLQVVSGLEGGERFGFMKPRTSVTKAKTAKPFTSFSNFAAASLTDSVDYRLSRIDEAMSVLFETGHQRAKRILASLKKKGASEEQIKAAEKVVARTGEKTEQHIDRAVRAGERQQEGD